MIDPHTAYMDDSGTDPSRRVRIVVAALCDSPVRKWKEFEKAWIKAEEQFRFDGFHMTEFAACRRESWCRDCRAGKKTVADHPWRAWSNTKRHDVLAELIQIICKYTEQGFGIAYTKEELDRTIKDPQLLAAAPPDEIPEDYYAFSATTCAGELAKWRASKQEFPPLKIVFDGEHKLELARAFLPGHQHKPRIREDGLENWFDLGANGISFESRKVTRPLLAADMLAWVTVKLRVAQLFPEAFRKKGGWGKEVSMIAFRFVGDGKFSIGHNAEAELKKWMSKEIKYWKKRPMTQDT